MPCSKPFESPPPIVMTSLADVPRPERLRRAVEEFHLRKQRIRHPKGDWREGLWFPSNQERRSCCVQRPTAANRQALESHCRTQTHVAALFEIQLGELKAVLREDRKRGGPTARQVIATYVAAPPPIAQGEFFDEFRTRSRREAFAKVNHELTECLPLLQALQAAISQDQESAVYRLKEAADSVENLRAAIRCSEALEARIASSGALLATLSAQFEQQKPKRRRSRSG